MKKNELSEMANDIKTLLNRQAEIKVQVEKTNGRVNALERFQYMAQGVLAIIVIFILPIFFELAKQWLENR